MSDPQVPASQSTATSESAAAGAVGTIPQSSALAEADPFSLTELMSRDPESYSRQDRDRIISALREDRARRENAERLAAETGKSTRSRAPKATGPEVPLDITSLGL